MTRACRVLVVDDNPIDLLLAQIALQQQSHPFNLMTANSGHEALQQLRSEKANAPDLILLDINMPGMNGFEVLRALKNDTDLQAIPVMMFTTSSEADDVQRAKELQASGYLLKNGSLEIASQQLHEVLDDWYHEQPK